MHEQNFAKFVKRALIFRAVAERQSFGRAGQLAGKLFVHSFLNLHEPNSGGHVERSGSQCQCSFTGQLAA